VKTNESQTRARTSSFAAYNAQENRGETGASVSIFGSTGTGRGGLMGGIAGQVQSEQSIPRVAQGEPGGPGRNRTEGKIKLLRGRYPKAGAAPGAAGGHTR